MKYFSYDMKTRTVVIEDDRIFAVKELRALLEPSRNVCKQDKTGEMNLRTKKELIYLYTYLD